MIVVSDQFEMLKMMFYVKSLKRNYEKYSPGLKHRVVGGLTLLETSHP